MPTIRFEDASVSYPGGVHALKGLTLGIPDGQMVGIIGASGAGKSTLLRMINRLTEPSAGRVLHGGQDVTALRGAALRRWRTDCAMIFQQFNLVQRLDVLTIVFANRGYQVLKGELQAVGAHTWGERAERMLSIVDPDISWVKLAEGMGVEAAA